ATITRPTLLALYPLLVLWAWFGWREGGGAERSAGPGGGDSGSDAARTGGVGLARWVRAGIFGLALALPVIAVTIYNEAISGDRVLIASQGGVNFFIGNSATSDGKTAFVPGWRDVSYESKEYEDTMLLAARSIAERAAGRSLSPREISSYWYGLGWSWIRSEPGAFFELLVHRAYFYFNHIEIPNNRDIGEYVGEYAPWMRALFPFGAGLLIPLGIVGLFVAGGSPRGRALLLLMLFGQAALIVLFFVCARFRIPTMPFWIVLAAHTIDSAAARPRAFPWARSIALALVFGAIAWSRFWNVDVPSDASTLAFNRASSFMEVGRFHEAEEYYRKSMALDTTDPRPHINLAGILAQQGRIPEAEDLLKQALVIAPDYGSFVWNNLAGLQMMRGEFEGAEVSLARSLAIDPRDADVWTNLGNVRLLRGNPVDALTAFDEALARGTTLGAQAETGRARALLAMGRRDDALASALSATERFPNEAKTWALLWLIASEEGEGATAKEAAARFAQFAGRDPVEADLPGAGGRLW
ncbi:MAG: tetratricopeptide repeat protein, partial [Gemmatimonadetes bacterium]|nr:tetratricopeptide repeat protein [Gemmatimonadota bacterium]